MAQANTREMAAAKARELVEHNIATIEAWRPADDWGRRMKQLNLTQAKAYLARIALQPVEQ